MGLRSFGKASVQAIFPMNRGMALRLTTAHYYTADGRDIDGKGLQPDVVLEQDSEGLERHAWTSSGRTNWSTIPGLKKCSSISKLKRKAAFGLSQHCIDALLAN